MIRKIQKPGILLVISLFLFVQYGEAQKKMTLEQAMEVAMNNSPDILQSRIEMQRNKQLLNAQLAQLKTLFKFDVTPIQYSKSEAFVDYVSKWQTRESIESYGVLSLSQPIKFTDGTLSLSNTLRYADSYSRTPQINQAGEKFYDKSSSYGYDNSLTLSYKQPLFTYNRTKLNLGRYRLSLESSTISYSIQMMNLEKMVTQYFYSIYQKQMALEIAKDEYSNQVTSKNIINDKVEAGLVAKEELYQAELNLSTSKSRLENKQVDLENAKDEFKNAIGISLFEDVEIAADIEYKPILVNLEQAINNGLQTRLELRQKQINLDNAEMDLIETKSNNEFRGDLSLSLGIAGNSPEFPQIYENPTNTPNVGVTFSIPVFDWGARKAKIKASELSFESKKIDKKVQENQIIINIRKVYRNLQNLINQIEIERQNEKNAQLTYEINLERYRNGDLTSMDLNLHQTQLSEKKMNLANSLISYKLELLNLKIQSLWDFENNSSFVPKDLQENIQK